MSLELRGPSQAALNSTYVQQWKANTAYAAGQAVLNPSGDVVTAKTTFTSGGTYSSANWNPVTQAGTLPWRSGAYYSAPTAAVGSSAGVNGRLALAPIFVPSTVTISAIAFEVTAVSSPTSATFTPTIYNDDGLGWAGTLKYAGAAVTTGTTGVKETTGLSVALGRGWYWIGGLILGATTTAPSLRMNNASMVTAIPHGDVSIGMSNTPSGTSQNSLAAAPDPFGALAGAISAGFIPRVLLKVA